jgi:hypothetical protein
MVVFRSEPLPKVEAIPSPGLGGQGAERVSIDRSKRERKANAR